ncbi:hypothetical protein ABZY44_32900 [Streptomyces sp. NPDC006544]|uniref:hypothetical protein n=1 Tax=Streptomyces sp. NPDC006544 TaxID=3154583 RepID=UPI0033B09010
MDVVRTLAEQLEGPESADTWFGYPPQKLAVHLAQAYTLLGDTRAAYRAQDDALALTVSPSVMTRALIAMDTAACLRVDGDPGEAAAMAAAVYDRLPPAYRSGLVHSRAQLLQLIDFPAQTGRTVAEERMSSGHGGPSVVSGRQEPPTACQAPVPLNEPGPAVAWIRRSRGEKSDGGSKGELTAAVYAARSGGVESGSDWSRP